MKKFSANEAWAVQKAIAEFDQAIDLMYEASASQKIKEDGRKAIRHLKNGSIAIRTSTHGGAVLARIARSILERDVKNNG